MTPVVVEVGRRRTFATALDWPGWCRGAKGEEAAMGALGAAAPRYAVVTREAGVAFDGGALAAGFEVVERVEGNATTDFGAPAVITGWDRVGVGDEEAGRLVVLLEAAWAVFDRVVAGAPPVLSKGPRGGGRDRDAIVDHVLAAEAAYGRSLGLRLRQPPSEDAAAVAAHRAAIAAALGPRPGGEPTAAVASAPETPARPGPGRPRRTKNPWPVRYAARRITWHVLDHAWEIEDRSHPT